MNLDPLSLTLSQIGYLVVTLTKKNYQQVVDELIKVGLHFFSAATIVRAPYRHVLSTCLVAILSTHQVFVCFVLYQKMCLQDSFKVFFWFIFIVSHKL